eukprot:ANDGO_06502.mRNA.1 hypothetical protein
MGCNPSKGRSQSPVSRKSVADQEVGRSSSPTTVYSGTTASRKSLPNQCSSGRSISALCRPRSNSQTPSVVVAASAGTSSPIPTALPKIGSHRGVFDTPSAMHNRSADSTSQIYANPSRIGTNYKNNSTNNNNNNSSSNSCNTNDDARCATITRKLVGGPVAEQPQPRTTRNVVLSHTALIEKRGENLKSTDNVSSAGMDSSPATFVSNSIIFSANRGLSLRSRVSSPLHIDVPVKVDTATLVVRPSFLGGSGAIPGTPPASVVKPLPILESLSESEKLNSDASKRTSGFMPAPGSPIPASPTRLRSLSDLPKDSPPELRAPRSFSIHQEKMERMENKRKDLLAKPSTDSPPSPLHGSQQARAQNGPGSPLVRRRRSSSSVNALRRDVLASRRRSFDTYRTELMSTLPEEHRAGCQIHSQNVWRRLKNSSLASFAKDEDSLQVIESVTEDYEEMSSPLQGWGNIHSMSPCTRSSHRVRSERGFSSGSVCSSYETSVTIVDESAEPDLISVQTLHDADDSYMLPSKSSFVDHSPPQTSINSPVSNSPVKIGHRHFFGPRDVPAFTITASRFFS